MKTATEKIMSEIMPFVTYENGYAYLNWVISTTLTVRRLMYKCLGE